MPTKPELEKQNKELKEEIRLLRKEKKTTTTEEVDYPLNGLSLIKEDGEYKLVHLGVNLEMNKASILSIEVAHKLKTAPHMAQMIAKKFLEEKIIQPAVNS